ncbi:SdrD B-like domain-containing protein [Fortiea contorta]|uniref:SdrD B-like domain-containing protein n=1 Tax=Fortiea contorta TaxID=1892405 RepID=UPI00034C96CF|nr:SdrD B-like domain-containing protein [Fortiea contorta]
MQLLFSHLPTVKSTFLTALLTSLQVLFPVSSTLATEICPPGTKPITIYRNKSKFPNIDRKGKAKIICVATGTIGDTVFSDINANHQQDAEEPGIGGVDVYLRDLHDNVISTTTTDSNGKYSFSDLLPGSYTVTVPHIPDGFTPTLIPPHPITLTDGQHFDQADFGFRPPSNGWIGDTVFRDRNGNGIQDNNEPGIPDVKVTLTLADGTTRSTTTDGNGLYSFSHLPPGAYQVAADVPPRHVLTTGVNPFHINLLPNQHLDHADFGFRKNLSDGGSIGDTVFSDRNGNGIQDNNEPGIPNVLLTLTLPGTDGILGNDDDTTQTTTTNDNGNYNFQNLPAGNYKVTVTPPADFPEITTGNLQVHLSLAARESRTDVDFGFKRSLNGSIGDFVFNDQNRDGALNSGDIGLPNVKLTLKNTDGEIVATTTSDRNGNYLFTDLPLGSYTVEVSQLDNFNSTTKTILFVNLTTDAPDNLDIDFGFANNNLVPEEVSLRLVKRITAVLKNDGQRFQYSSFIDDPNDKDDEQIQPNPLGQYELLTRLSSGDEVEYTIYFRTGQALENLTICDLIPQGTTYVNNSISVTNVGFGAEQGRFFSPLTPLEDVPQSQACENRHNINGTVIVKLGNIAGGQFGLVRFRVKID